MDADQIELTIPEIEHCYPDQWVLVEETAWDVQGHPSCGIVRATSGQRDDLRAPLQALHQRPQVKTFIFYTGEQISADLTAVVREPVCAILRPMHRRPLPSPRS